MVQNNTSKKVSAATLFQNLANVNLSGNINVGGTHQSLGAPGIISLTTPITELTVDGVGGTLQLPLGTDGQLKIVVLKTSSGGTFTVNNANVAGNGNITFDTVGDSATLQYITNKWYVIGGTANVTY